MHPSITHRRQHLHVGLTLDMARTNFRADVASERPAPPLLHRELIATLRPSTAALLCHAARLRPGEVVCDFMAGGAFFGGLDWTGLGLAWLVGVWVCGWWESVHPW